MSKMMVIEVEGKEYILGFPSRKSIKKAEDKGFDILGKQGKTISLADNIFYAGLLAKQPDITEEESTEIIEKYINEGGDLEEIIKFLSNQYQGFIKSQDKTKKKAKIVNI